jgi:hypothetical protein
VVFLNLSVAGLLVNVSVALALLAVLEKAGDAEDKDGVNTWVYVVSILCGISKDVN